MDKRIRIALIPAYEPEPLLLELLADLREAGLKTVVVDDGSGPAFSDIFKQAKKNAVVLTHVENCGKGNAIKTGLLYIKEHFQGQYTVVTVDADGQHRVGDAVRVCKTAEYHPRTLILGSRALAGKIPLRSRFGNTVTRNVYRISTGQNVHDTQTGLRGFNQALLTVLLEIPGERYEYEMNVLLECSRRSISVMEIEIATVYHNNNAGSHFDTLKDSFRIYKEILKFSASSLTGFFVDYGLFSLLTLATGGLEPAFALALSNVSARVVSASVNFTLNRKFVFNSKKSLWKSGAQYFLLAAAILAGNTLVLSLLVDQLSMNRYLAKFLTELVFFALSWLIQRRFIFSKKTGCNNTTQTGNTILTGGPCREKEKYEAY